MALRGGEGAVRIPARWKEAFWWTAGLLLTAYLLMTVCLIIYRHPFRIDFTREEVNTLSPETLNRLRLLQEEVRVVLPVLFQEENPLDEIQKQILLRGRALLSEYVARQPRLVVEAELNVARPDHFVAWKRLCDQLDLSPLQYNRFIFFTAQSGLRQTVTPDDLAVYDRPQGPHDRTPPQVRKFRAESAFTAALTRLIQREKRKVYAAEDHREAGSRDDSPQGISVFRRELEANGFEVVPFRLRDEPRVPANCEVLLIAAPDAPFDLHERQKLNDHLLAGGRLLVALGPADTGLEALLDSWGIGVQTGRILERHVYGPRAVWEPSFVARDFNVAHRITEEFRPRSFEVYFSNARALDPKGGESLKGEFLVRTSRTPPSFLDRNKNRLPDEAEVEGRWVVAAAAWRPRPIRPPPDYRQLDARIVVLGDVTPLLNQVFPQHSHREFLLNSLNWLLGREEQVVAGSTAWTERRLRWDPGIERFIFWVPIFLFPGVVLSFGAFVYFLRRA